jgi:uncharacterized protein (DUF302 family)
VLHVQDLGKTLWAKGFTFTQQCKNFEFCNPRHAANVLSCDMRLNMVLPYCISVYTDNVKTKVGLIKPAQMLLALSNNPSLLEIAEQVEISTV